MLLNWSICKSLLVVHPSISPSTWYGIKGSILRPDHWFHGEKQKAFRKNGGPVTGQLFSGAYSIRTPTPGTRECMIPWEFDSGGPNAAGF
jgi:hypothetical protein